MTEVPLTSKSDEFEIDERQTRGELTSSVTAPLTLAKTLLLKVGWRWILVRLDLPEGGEQAVSIGIAFPLLGRRRGHNGGGRRAHELCLRRRAPLYGWER